MTRKQLLALALFAFGLAIGFLATAQVSMVIFWAWGLLCTLILIVIWPRLVPKQQAELNAALDALSLDTIENEIETELEPEVEEKAPKTVEKVPFTIENDPLNPLRALSPKISKLIDDRDELVALRKELETAQSVQKNMLPDSATIPKIAEIATELVPSTTMSGDFFDYFVTGHNRVSTVVADVSDKGLSSAIFASQASGLVRVIGSQLRDPGAILTEANKHMAARNSGMLFVTLVYVSLDYDKQQIDLANAGHEPPILIRKNGNVSFLRNDAAALPLGLSSEQYYSTLRADFAPGDKLVMYTDGLTEAQNTSGEFVGRDFIFDLCEQGKALSPQDLKTSILEAINQIEAQQDATDDRTLMVLGSRDFN